MLNCWDEAVRYAVTDSWDSSTTLFSGQHTDGNTTIKDRASGALIDIDLFATKQRVSIGEAAGDGLHCPR